MSVSTIFARPLPSTVRSSSGLMRGVRSTEIQPVASSETKSTGRSLDAMRMQRVYREGCAHPVVCHGVSARNAGVLTPNGGATRGYVPEHLPCRPPDRIACEWRRARRSLRLPQVFAREAAGVGDRAVVEGAHRVLGERSEEH